MSQPPFQPNPQPMNYQPQPSSSGGGAGLAIASLIVGIIAVLLSFVPCVNTFTSWPLALIGVILGVVAIVLASKTPGGKKGMAIGGIICCLLAAVITPVVNWALVQGAESLGNAGSAWVLEHQAGLVRDTTVMIAESRGVDQATIDAAVQRYNEQTAAILEDVDMESVEADTQELEAAAEELRSTLGVTEEELQQQLPEGQDLNFEFDPEIDQGNTPLPE